MKEIPLIDVRQSGLVDVAEKHKDGGRALLEASKDSFGWVSRAVSAVALPVGDSLAKWWLEKSNNPYRHEINAVAEKIGVKGIHALNLSYEWGCTSGVYQQGDTPVLARVLDWPFPALGENTLVAHQTGTAGDFYNITWPGLVGTFNAVAPNRFAAAINQAPMRRGKTHLVMDWVRNRFDFHKQNALPPAHLLRHVFEMAKNYDEAKDMLCHTPLPIPVIFVLAGTKAGEGCVIERLEEGFAIRELNAHTPSVSAANHFESRLNGVGYGWWPHGIQSHARSKSAQHISAEKITEDFDWFVEPIANMLSRMVMRADASTGKFSVMGTAGAAPVTKTLKM